MFTQSMYYNMHSISNQTKGFTFFQPVTFQHGLESCHLLFQFLLAGFCCLVSERRKKKSQMSACWEDQRLSLAKTPSILLLIQPPVARLSAPPVASPPPPPPPRCPAPGSSSACCKPSALPLHPARPERPQQTFL